MFAGQFADFMILLLVVAALVSGAIGEPDLLRLSTLVRQMGQVKAWGQTLGSRNIPALRKQLAAAGVAWFFPEWDNPGVGAAAASGMRTCIVLRACATCLLSVSQFPGMAADAGLTSSSWARGPHHQWGPMAGDGDPTRMQFHSEFEWIAPSGLGLLTHYMPAHYSAGWWMDSSASLAEAEQAT